jgi:hypothetical protein
VYYYIQNRTNEGDGRDPIETMGPGQDYYDPAISEGITDWIPGDECIIVVNRDYGTYGVDHAGYVAFQSVTLNNDGVQVAPAIDLQKIPVPQFVANGSDFIEFDWPAINDPGGIVAGYTVYRSTTNGTVSGDADWTLIGGTVNAPITGLTFNDTSISGGITYYYSLKIVFTGYIADDPVDVDNYECTVFGEGSTLMEAPAPPPGIDSIMIVTNPGTGTVEVLDQTIWVGWTITYYAAAFNSSSGYVGDVSVTWSVVNAGGATATTTPGPGISSDFDAMLTGGTATVTADDGSGHTDTVIFTITPPTVDSIMIVDTAGTGTTEILDQTVNVGFTITGHAAGYNATSGYVNDVSVTWSVNNVGGATATTVPGPATSSDFDADINGGTATVTADDGLGHTDTVVFTINPPAIDYINIVTQPATGLNDVLDQTIDVGFGFTYYAAAFNTTSGYLTDVSVTWSVGNSGGASASAPPGPATSTLFDGGISGGQATLTADDGFGRTDIVVFTITPPTVDFIVIENMAGGLGGLIADQTVNVGFTITGYAAGYNTTSGYVNDVSVTWSVLNAGGATATTVPGPGISSDFNAMLTGGTATVTADDGSGHTDTVIFTITPPTVDYIMIVDTSGTGTSEILDQIIILLQNRNCYAAGFNTTSGYVNDVTVTWSVVNGGGAAASAPPGPATSTIFDSGASEGTATLEADDGSGHTDTVIFTIIDYSVDYIMIVDTPGGGINEVLDQTIWVGWTMTMYAAGFNNSAPGNGHIGDFSVTWSIVNGGGATATTTPGPGVSSDFDAMLTGGTATVTADDGSGHTDTVIFTITPPTVDSIMIVDTAGTGATEILDQIVIVGFTITGYAASYNVTAGYIGDISVSWSVVNGAGATATTTPGPGISSDFNAMLTGGTATVTADDGSGHTDTVIFTITPPTVDYIMIVDTAGTGATEILDQTIIVGFTITGYAASFNTTAGYIGDVSVTWSVFNAGGATATTTPGPGVSSDFDAMLTGGTATVTADDGSGNTDTVLFTITPPTVDSLMIVDTAGTGASEILDQTVIVGFTITGYAAVFNTTAGYIGDVSVAWSILNVGGATATTTPGPAISSDFNAMLTGGTATVTADDGSGHTDTVVFTITPPTVDSIMIVDTAGTGANEVLDQTVIVGFTATGYAASFNTTAGYIGDVSVTWSVMNAGGATATTTPGPGISSDFDAMLTGGTATVTADDGSGHTDTVIFTITPPTVDSIVIEDMAGGAGTMIADQTVVVGFTITGYAAGYNATAGYLMDVSVTWSVGNVGGATATTTPGPGISSDFDAMLTGGTATVTADDGSGHTDTVVFTITPPTVDYITIVDTMGTGATEILDQSVIMSETKMGYAASFNDTVGYLGDISVDWSVVTGGGATASTSPLVGDTSTFDAELASGTGTWTADDGAGHTDTVVFTILGAEIDYIMIMDAADNLGSAVGDMTYAVFETDNFFVATFNDTLGYLGDVTATWSSDDTAVGQVDDPVPPTAIFSAQQVALDDSCIVTASYMGMTDVTGDLTVLAPTVDSIEIRNAPEGGGVEVGDRTFGVGDSDELYASAYNDTIGYMGEVLVIWTIAPATGVGTVDTTGVYTNFTALEVNADATCVVTANYQGVTAQTGTITVLKPTVDYIIIQEVAGDGGAVVGDEVYNAAATDTFYAVGYNDTAGFVMNVDATWVSSDIVVGTVGASGASTTFTAQTLTEMDTCIVTATYSGISNTTGTLTVNAGIDVDPPAKPGDITFIKDGDDVIVAWPPNLESDLNKYILQRTTDPNDGWTNITETGPLVWTYTDSDLKPDTKYYYRVIAVDDAGNPSDPSEAKSITTDPEDAFPWLLLILLIIIVIVILLLVILMAKKKKPEEEMPPAAAPMEEAPAEEEFAAEEEFEEAGGYEEEYAPEEVAPEETTYEEAPSEEVEYEEEPAVEEEEPETTTPPPPPPPPPPA